MRERLDFTTIPSHVNLGGLEALDGRRRFPPELPPERLALEELAMAVTTFVLEHVGRSDRAADLERAMGPFLLSTPASAAEVGSTRIRIETALESGAVLELARPDDRVLEGIAGDVAASLEAVALNAAELAVFEGGVAHRIANPRSRALVEALIAAGRTSGALAWLARAWGDAIGADVAARAIHARLTPMLGAEAAAEALLEPFPEGRHGVWLLTAPGASGEMALACRDVPLARLASRLGREGGPRIHVPRADADRRVTFFSSAFSPAGELARSLANAFSAEPDEVPVTGQRLWRVSSLGSTHRWLSVARARVLVPAREGGVEALRWRDGALAWRLGGERVDAPSLSDGEGDVYVTDRDGVLARLAAADGHPRWAWYLRLRTPALGPVPALRVLSAREHRLLVLENDVTLLVLDARDGEVLERRPIGPRAPDIGEEGSRKLSGDAVVVSLDGALVALDARSGARLLAREGPHRAGARTEQLDRGWAVETDAGVVFVDRALIARTSVALGGTSAWAAAGEALIAGDAGPSARLHTGPALATTRVVSLPAAPTVAFAADGELFVACADGRAYRIDSRRARVSAVLDGVDVPPRSPVCAQGIGIFYGSYGGALAAHRVR